MNSVGVIGLKVLIGALGDISRQGHCEWIDTLTGLYKRVRILFYFSYFSTKTYAVCTQKNRLNETVLLSTQTYV